MHIYYRPMIVSFLVLLGMDLHMSTFSLYYSLGWTSYDSISIEGWISYLII